MLPTRCKSTRLPMLPHGTTGILATKLHAVLDRGTRRDFVDLDVTLQSQSLGVFECPRSIRQVYQQEVNGVWPNTVRLA